MYKVYNDAFVFNKLLNGQTLTAEDINLLLDTSSPDNVVKRMFDSFINEAEIESHLREKENIKEAILALLNTLSADFAWRSEQEKKYYYDQQAQIAAEQYAQDTLINLPEPEKTSLLKLFENLFENQVDPILMLALNKQLDSAISDEKIDLRTLNTILHLCSHPDHELRKFIFSVSQDANSLEKSAEASAKTIVDNIIHVANLLKNPDFGKLIKHIEENRNPKVEKNMPYRPFR